MKNIDLNHITTKTAACILTGSIGLLPILAVSNPVAAEATVKNAEQQSAKAATKTQSNEKTRDKRKEVVVEAVSTLRETQDALKELDQGKNKEALASLERATGKLEIVLARDPKMALLPIDVRVRTSDLYATLDTIRSAKQQAQTFLRDGRMQDARNLLANLASETVISTTNLPVATYPAALKQAAKLIDQNKPAEAKEVLQNALDTLVVTDLVIPLPVARAKVSLQKAETLAKINNRTAAQNKELSDLVTTADNDIRLGEELGYGRKADYDSFHKEIAQIRSKTSNGKFGSGFFDQIKAYIESMTKASQHKNG